MSRKGVDLGSHRPGRTPPRGFLEASVCQIFTVSSFIEEPYRLCGPCVQAGYQFASRGGFTTMLSLGLGYAPGVPEGGSGFGALANVGLGYTWRRSARD